MSNKLFVGFSVKFIISWNKYLMINTMKIFLIKKKKHDYCFKFKF